MGFLGRWLSAVWRFVTSKPWYALAIAVVIVFAVSAISTYISNTWYVDSDDDRGALNATEAYGEAVRSIAYLDQGWKPSDSMWYDTVTQGSDLLPYDFFLVLRNKDGSLFRDNDRMNAVYRYLPRRPTPGNRDGLPIGMVRDNYRGRNYMGFTCAACHTGQVNYHGQAYRIDGAPAMADMDGFLNDMSRALVNTQTPGKAHDDFVQAVLALKRDYSTAAQVDADLKTYAQRILTYRIVNRSDQRVDE